LSNGVHARALIFLMRVAGLALRFALVVYLARVFGVESVGQFGYLQAVAVLAPPLLGLGLHFRINREIAAWPVDRVGVVIRDKFALILLVAICITALGYAGVASGHLTRLQFDPIAYWTASLVALLETLAAECYLVMISLNRIVAANVTSFLRTAIWVPPFIAATYLGINERSIQTLIYFWLVGLLCSHAFLAWTFRAWPWRKIATAPHQYRYIFAEFKGKTFPVFISDLSQVGSQYLDRFVLGAFLSLHQVGVYTFFWSIANGVSQLILVSFVQPALPRLIQANEEGGSGNLLNTVRQMIQKSLPLLLGLCGVSALFVYVALPYLHRPELHDWYGILLLMLAAVLIRGVADTLNYALYVMRKDRQLVTANVLSIVFALASATLFTWLLGMHGASLSLVLSALAIFWLRARFLKDQHDPN
jgi:O-antigen/teichoic acid export membrane protein